MNDTSLYTALNNELKTQRKKQNIDDGGAGQPTIELPKYNTNIKAAGSDKKSHGFPRQSAGRHSIKINTVIISNWVRNDKKATGRLAGALRYNQERERSRNEEERTFFTARDENLDRADIRKEIRSNFGNNIAFHTVILSPGDNSVDIKEFTRETMDEWQQHLGYRIDYYAIEHRNTDHYHTHLVIPATSIDKESDIKFTRKDLADLRDIANDYLARERMIDRAFDRAISREFGFDRQEQLDREIQAEFHMRNKDYRDEQEAIGLDTYSDYVKDWKELGIGQLYDPGETNWESDRQMMNELFGNNEEDMAKERETEKIISNNTMMSGDRNDTERDDDDDEHERHR